MKDIVRRCRDGDKAAFEELFDGYQPRLKYYVRRLADDDAHADDILQNTWMAVVRKLHQLKDAERFDVWLYRIARNAVYDAYRRKERFVHLPEDDECPAVGSDEPEFDADDAEALHKALIRLKPHHREVLTLRFIEQMPYESIAEIVECSVGTIRTRVFYAKKSLREELERDHA